MENIPKANDLNLQEKFLFSFLNDLSNLSKNDSFKEYYQKQFGIMRDVLYKYDTSPTKERWQSAQRYLYGRQKEDSHYNSTLNSLGLDRNSIQDIVPVNLMSIILSLNSQNKNGTLVDKIAA